MTSIESSASTLPNSPIHNGASGQQDDGTNKCFATLTPLNSVAKARFKDVVLAMRRDSTWAVRARGSIVANTPIGSDSDADPDGSVSIEIDSADAQGEVYEALQDDPDLGHYQFSFSVPPYSMETGWVLGSDEKAVDVLLVDEPHRGRIAHRHCQLNFGPSSDAFFLRCQPGAEVVVDGKHVLSGLNMQAMTAETGLQIGDLSYLFQYNQHLPQHLFREELHDLRERRGWLTVELPATLTPTPGPDAVRIQDFSIATATVSGASGTVGFGVRLSDGQPVVAKRFKVTQGQHFAVQNEIRCLQHLKHDHIVRLARGFEVPSSAFQPFATPILDLTLILEPAAPYTLNQVLRQVVPAQSSLTLARDLAAALDYLHSAGYLHRDVKPANIGIFLKSPKAVLLDLGHCVQATVHIDHYKGTIAYLPPEVTRLKQWSRRQTRSQRQNDRQEPFGPPADVWSLGLSLAECLVLRERISNEWRFEGITDAQNRVLLKKVLDVARSDDECGPLVAPLSQMLQLSPTDRPTCRQLLDIFRQELDALERSQDDFKERWKRPRR